MNLMILLAHPRLGSFNHALAHAAQAAALEDGHTSILHDIYAEQFPPLLPADEIPSDGNVPPLIERHVRELEASEGLVIVHPNWWGMPPAILTGWVDRVIRPGRAYRFEEGDSGEGVPIGLLTGKRVVVFNTTNTAPERERRVFGDPLEAIWRHCICGLCGIRDFERRVFGTVVTSTPDQRAAWLREAADLIHKTFPCGMRLL